MRHWGGEHVFPGSAKAKPPQQPAKPANQAALSVPTHGEQSLAPRELPSSTGTNGEGAAKEPNLCPACGEPLGADRSGSVRWCRCVRNAEAVIFPLSTAADGSTTKQHQDRLLAQSFVDVQRLPDAVAVDAMVLGTGFTKVTTDGGEHVPYEHVMPLPPLKMEGYPMVNDPHGGIMIPDDHPLAVAAYNGWPNHTKEEAAAAVKEYATRETTNQVPMPPTSQPTVSLFDEDVTAAGAEPPTAPAKGKTDRKAYMREYIAARRQREREDKQRAAEAGTGATDQ